MSMKCFKEKCVSMTDQNSHQKTAGLRVYVGVVQGWGCVSGVVQGWECVSGVVQLAVVSKALSSLLWTTERKTQVCGADLLSQPLGGGYWRIRSSKPVSVNTGVQRPAWDLVSKKKWERKTDRDREKDSVCMWGAGRKRRKDKERDFPSP